jgi:hypothetical protein
VLVNGQQYGGSLDDPQEFQAFVLQATSATFNDSESTPDAHADARRSSGRPTSRHEGPARAGPSCRR